MDSQQGGLRPPTSLNPGRPPDSAAQAELRETGRKLYLSGEGGRRISLREIAHRLGVHLKTIQNWRDRDGWTTEAQAALAAAGGAPDPDRPDTQLQDHMLARIRRYVRQLDKIIEDPEAKSDLRFRALTVYVDIYRKMGGRLSEPGADKPLPPPITPFRDDLARREEPRVPLQPDVAR